MQQSNVLCVTPPVVADDVDSRDWSPSSVALQGLPTGSAIDLASSRPSNKSSRGDQRDESLSVRRRKDNSGPRGQRCEERVVDVL